MDVLYFKEQDFALISPSLLFQRFQTIYIKVLEMVQSKTSKIYITLQILL